MDTRSTVYTLFDYHLYYGTEKIIDDAEELISNISSVALLDYISECIVNLYLSNNGNETGKIQFMLVSRLLDKCDVTAKKKWKDEVLKQGKNGNSPIMLWDYSCLLFYGLIFKNFNNSAERNLSSDEAKRVFDALLIVNGIANGQVDFDEDDLQNTQEEDKMNEFLITNLIYQKDYASSLDFNNQVARGASFFKYLENNAKYKDLVIEYYENKNVSGYLRMFRNLMVLFTEVNIGHPTEERSHQINLQTSNKFGEIDLDYIESFCINSEISNYMADDSFGVIRNKFLFKISQFEFLVLNINFLLDQFYKAQVFSFMAFLKTKGIENNFLSEKGKDFSEEIYLREVLDLCFPGLIKFYGSECINSKREELCDVYLRDSNKICLIEFKDVLLSASAKNSGNQERLFKALEEKFLKNKKNKSKGITQLLNAVEDVDNHSVSFDTSVPDIDLEIFPVIIYTDNTFGVEGVNNHFKKLFTKEIENLDIKNVKVRDVVFINLNYFEMHQDYLNHNYLDIFVIIDQYLQHIENTNFSLTPFEVFSRFYMNKYVPEELGTLSSFTEIMNDIISAK